MRPLAITLLAFGSMLLLLPPAWADDPPHDPKRAFRGEDHRIRVLELRGARLLDAVRLVSEISSLNVVATAEAGDTRVSVYLRDVTAGHAIETLCKVSGLWYRRDEETGTFRIMTTEEYQKDHVVYRRSSTRVFTLKHPNALVVATAIEHLFGERVELFRGLEEEEATDLPAGFGIGSGSTTGSGSLGVGTTQGFTSSGYDRYGNRGRSPTDYLRRSTGGVASNRPSDRIIREPLTPDQIARIEAARGTGGALPEELIQEISQRDPTIYVTVNRQHNLIVVRTSDTRAMDEIADLVTKLDRPTPQVLLEMQVLSLNIGDSFRSLFDVQATGGPSSSGPASTQPANPLLPFAATGSRNTFGTGNFALEDSRLVYQFLTDTFRARLQLLSTDNRVQVLASPVILASNNRPARMFVGEERVLTTGVNTDVITPATGATTSVVEPVTEVRDIGNTLVVVPKINADRTVTLFLLQDSSTVNERSAVIPVAGPNGSIQEFPIDTVNTANLQVTVVAKDGMTLAVGGLIRAERTHRDEKVPGLGDLPGVGNLFRKRVRENNRSELLLLIRPRVVFTPAEAESATVDRVNRSACDPCTREQIGLPTQECEPCPVCPPGPGRGPVINRKDWR